MAAKKPARDLYSEVTDSIVRSLETCGDWERPWTSVSNGAMFPRNLISKKNYRGINVWLLWDAAVTHGYTSGVWATFKQWFVERDATDAERERDADVDDEFTLNRDGKVTTRCVRKGEESTLVVLWKPFDRKATAKDVAEGRATEVGKKVRGLLLRHYNVFAAEQVDGYVLPEQPVLDEFERDAAAETFFDNVGARVEFGGNTAGYMPFLDSIVMPMREQFVDTEHFYSVMAHEHTHWTGHKTRCDRSEGMSGRFGNDAYAMEELVAELGAAFVSASLGFHATMRDDHASYVKNWVSVLKNDNRAIFTAASKAQQAADFLFGLQDVVEDIDDDEMVTGPRVDFDAWAA